MSFQDKIRQQLERKARGRRHFLQLVEFHQRAWGQDTYKGKPTLEQIMNARVVAFWYPTGVDDDIHMTVTLHRSLDDISSYCIALIMHTKVRLPVLRLAKVFVDQQPKRVKEVKIVFD